MKDIIILPLRDLRIFPKRDPMMMNDVFTISSLVLLIKSLCISESISMHFLGFTLISFASLSQKKNVLKENSS